MALPTSFSVLLQDQVKLIIASGGSVSRKYVDYYDGSTYRNTFPNQQVIVKPSNVTSDFTWETDTASLQVPGSPAGATVENENTAGLNSRVFLDDVVSAIEPRIWKKIRTRVEFWSGAIGNAMTLSVTTVNANATVTVSDNSLLTPGQAISGTGIPTGAIIFSVPFTTRTQIVLSHQCTAGATVVGTLTGSNYLGGYWEDEEVGGAGEVSILV